MFLKSLEETSLEKDIVVVPARSSNNSHIILKEEPEDLLHLSVLYLNFISFIFFAFQDLSPDIFGKS